MRGSQLFNNRRVIEDSPVQKIDEALSGITLLKEGDRELMIAALKRRFSRDKASIIALHVRVVIYSPGVEAYEVEVGYGHGYRSSETGNPGYKEATCLLVPATGWGIYRPACERYLGVKDVKVTRTS